ncbi:MAG: FkbM family methyltransferase [Candidatus Accumulibacter sp.]|jgi:FkbM family methyltransferase|nr:FkbM family methyltransferase [Accumulibacter sp.]
MRGVWGGGGVILYGAGRALPECLELLKKHGGEPIAVCDKRFAKEKPNECLGLQTIAPRELLGAKYKDCNVLISNVAYYEEICSELLTWGISEKRLFLPGFAYRCTNYIHTREYFSEPMLPEKGEVYVDCGMLSGGSVKQFISFCGGDYKKIYGFEPSPNSYKRVIADLQGVERLHVVQKAVWSEETELRFAKLEEEGTFDPGGARIDSQGEEIVCTATIDNTVGADRVTFIKMDVEGAELEALKGAEKVLLRDNPKLAICLYHKPEDIVEITLYLWQLHPENKYFLRHHNYVVSGERYMLDTVLYSLRKHEDLCHI